MTDKEFNELQEAEKRLSTYDGDDQVLPVGLIKKKLGEAPPAKFKLFPGIESIEKYTKYFKNGDFVLVSGPTKNGKTLLTQTFTRNFSNQKQWGVFFSYEVNAPQFISQFGEDTPYFYMPSKLSSRQLRWIEERIWEAKLKYDCRYAIIDHLHYLMNYSEAASGRADLIIGAICRELKSMALKHDIVIFLVAHVTKIPKGVEPDFGNVRDSGLVVTETDACFMVWRKDKVPGGACVKLLDREFGTYNQMVHVKKVGAYLEDDFEENMKEGIY